MTTDRATLHRTLEPRERESRFPRLALRRRSNEHPLAMFAVVAATAFVAMAFSPSSGSALASIGSPSLPPLKISDEPRTTQKGNRLLLSDIDIACRGQAWGAESAECLTVIAHESGKDEARKVRLIAAAPNGSAPNVF